MRHLQRTLVSLSLFFLVVACQPSTDEAESAQPAERGEAATPDRGAEETDAPAAANAANAGGDENLVPSGRDQRAVPAAGVRQPAPRTICFVGSENLVQVEPADVAARLREEAGDRVISLVLTAPDQGVRALADSIAAELQLNAIAQPQLRELGGDISFEQRRSAARAGNPIGGVDNEANDRAFARAVNLRGLFDTMIAAGTVAVVVAPPDFGTLLLATHLGAGMQAAFEQEALAGGAVRCVTMAVEPPAARTTDDAPNEALAQPGSVQDVRPEEEAADTEDEVEAEGSEGELTAE